MEPIQILQKYWGYNDFRPLQSEIIQSVISNKDTLALLPTGGGKSICYQIPALAMSGICIVISPLIALMKDQVEQLKRRGIPAAAIYSGMHISEIDRTLDNCIYGNVKLLYLSPERLQSTLAFERMKKMKINLIAVDEAHCISQWGYDFRPSYRQIAEFREYFPKVPFLAVTATATPEVATDIQEQLEFKKDANFFQQSFERSNLTYVVLQEQAKTTKLLEILNKVNGSGIVYARSRRKTKEIAETLKRNQISADFYHAGLKPTERSFKQDRWIKNEVRIMVATNAFGMGIDKSNVRTVVHMDVPDSLEAYFQEAGRAGRDGNKSYAVLLYQKEDKLRMEKQFEQAFPTMAQIRNVYRALGSYYQLAVGGGLGNSYDFNLSEFAQRFDFEAITAHHCLKILKDTEWIDLTDAVFVSAKVMITASKEELYSFQLGNKKFDPLIKTLLRSYQGAFSHHVKINEGQLSKFLKIQIPVLHTMFKHLAMEHIIDYQPPKDKPSLIFLKERVSAENLLIDTKYYRELQQRKREKLNAVFNYVNGSQCRSSLLLDYFGERNSNRCNLCDICTGRTKTNLSKEEYKQYSFKIKDVLTNRPLPIEDIMSKFSARHHNKVLKVINYLLENEYLGQNSEQLLYWDSNEN